MTHLRFVRSVATCAAIAIAAMAASVCAQQLSTPHGEDAAAAWIADSGPARAMEAPGDPRPVAQKFWWSDAWYNGGQLPAPVNHAVTRRDVSYVNPKDGTDVPAILFRPKTEGKFPAVLFQHGRRGLDDLVKRLAMRIAARGFIVLAPDVYNARFIGTHPVAHDPAFEGDVGAGLDFLLKQPDISTSRACLVSHTRGGYYTLMVAVKQNRQARDAACYVSTYPHWQNPNAAEADQVYRYAGEIDRLTLPALIMIGEFEQYQRRRSIETAIKSMKTAGRDVRLIIYPGVGRGFDFRPANVRSFADDLASKDAVQRTADFLNLHLAKWRK